MTDTALLKYFLEERRITQTKLASLLNISFQALNGKINGKRGFSVDEIYTISKVLNLTLEEKERIFFCNKCTR